MRNPCTTKREVRKGAGLRHWGGAFLCRSGGGSRSTGSHSAYSAGQAAGERVTSAHIAACWSPKGGRHERH